MKSWRSLRSLFRQVVRIGEREGTRVASDLGFPPCTELSDGDEEASSGSFIPVTVVSIKTADEVANERLSQLTSNQLAPVHWVF